MNQPVSPRQNVAGKGLSRTMKQLGWPGLAGLALLALGWWMEHDLAVTQQAEAEQTASQARRLRSELLASAAPATKAGHPARQAQATPQEAWATLWHGLPDVEARLGLQKAVLSAAQAHGLQVNTVQYQGEAQAWAAQGGLWRQRMNLPMEGSFSAWRAWLAAVLREPALSIDSVDVQRPDPTSDGVKAQVRLSLWWRDDPAAAGRAPARSQP